MAKRISMLEALERGRRNNETRMTWEEVMALGLYCGMLYGEIGEALRFSYRLQRDGNDQYLMRFARQIEDRVREKVDADRTALLAEIAQLRKALETMTKCEPCDCGCPNGETPVLMKPQHYYAIAKDALHNAEVSGRAA